MPRSREVALIEQINVAFMDVPFPGRLPEHSQDFEKFAPELALMSEELERWYLPKIMGHCIYQIQLGIFPLQAIEHVIFALDPDGILNKHSSDKNEKFLHQQRLHFLESFTKEQRIVICKWITFISHFSQVKFYFRSFRRINDRFCIGDGRSGRV